jgi:hypothetical protein
MKEKKSLLSVVWALIFSTSFVGSIYYLSKASASIPIALLIIAINSILFGIYTIKFIRSIKSLDEVQIRIQLEAVSYAFSLSLLLVMILGMAGLVTGLGLNNISYLYIFPLFFLFYLIGLFISKRKY